MREGSQLFSQCQISDEHGAMSPRADSSKGGRNGTLTVPNVCDGTEDHPDMYTSTQTLASNVV